MLSEADIRESRQNRNHLQKTNYEVFDRDEMATEKDRKTWMGS